MSLIVRLSLWLVGWLATLIVLGAGLLVYLLWTPAPTMPHLTGVLTQGAIEIAGLRRTYALYMPQHLATGAPLVIALHGSDENSARMRIETGYAFERLADEHSFAVAYPNASEGNWNACNIEGDYASNKLNTDDVGFLTALVDKLVTETGIDRARVFATGTSRGGQMAYRLALEAPSRFRAVAAVAANLPTPANFKCAPPAQGTSSILIMNGTADPLTPFNGGEVQLFGLYKRGMVRSSRESGQYFADLNHIGRVPAAAEREVANGVRVEDVTWRNDAPIEVDLVAIHGGGHNIPQPYWRAPRLLGPTPREPNGPAMVWAFFDRQTRRR